MEKAKVMANKSTRIPFNGRHDVPTAKKKLEVKVISTFRAVRTLGTRERKEMKTIYKVLIISHRQRTIHHHREGGREREIGRRISAAWKKSVMNSCDAVMQMRPDCI